MTTVADAIGQRHARFANPSALRIACLVPSITETLFALGLGNKVVARTGFCIHPEPAIRDVPKVGGTKEISREELINQLEPEALVTPNGRKLELVEMGGKLFEITRIVFDALIFSVRPHKLGGNEPGFETECLHRTTPTVG